jgi:predicted dehydrogenase
MRIGVLGAARIAPGALIRPARAVDGVTVTAIAARDPGRAAAFAEKHGIPGVRPDYAALIDDPDIDAVYIPLPNGLHAQWTLKAIAAGKHVLCEKPFTSNASEAKKVAEAAAATPQVVVMEAFHYRYHPLSARMKQIVESELGEIREIHTAMCFPLPVFNDIRYRFDLAGGSLMDAGCYAVHAARLLGPREPVVTSASAKRMRRDPRIDRAMRIFLSYGEDVIGSVHASMWSSTVLRISARVVGRRGCLRVFNFVAPQFFHRLSVTVGGRRRTERVAGEATYTHQLRAFLAATRGEPANLTPPSDSVATMSIIDAAYAAAGLPIR